MKRVTLLLVCFSSIQALDLPFEQVSKEAELHRLFNEGVATIKPDSFFSKPELKFKIGTRFLTGITSRLYGQYNNVDPAFLWPLQKLDYNGGDPFGHPVLDQTFFFPTIATEAKIKCGDLSIKGVVSGAFGGVGFAGGFYTFNEGYIDLEFDQWTISGGVRFHPLCVVELFPDMVDLIIGTPIVPTLSYIPCIRVKRNFENGFAVSVTAGSNYLINENGPSGFNSIYIRQGLFPITNLRIEREFEKGRIGFAINVQRLVPRTFAPQVLLVGGQPLPIPVDEQVWTAVGMAYFGYNAHYVQLKTQILYGTDGVGLYCLGGYGAYYENPQNLQRQYQGIPFLTYWGDLTFGEEKWRLKPGIFFGFSHSFNVKKPFIMEEIEGAGTLAIYTIDPAIFRTIDGSDTVQTVFGAPLGRMKTVTRVSPRFWFALTEKCKLGIEVHWFRSVIGTFDAFANLPNPTPVNLFRYVIGGNYDF